MNATSNLLISDGMQLKRVQGQKQHRRMTGTSWGPHAMHRDEHGPDHRTSHTRSNSVVSCEVHSPAVLGVKGSWVQIPPSRHSSEAISDHSDMASSRLYSHGVQLHGCDPTPQIPRKRQRREVRAVTREKRRKSDPYRVVGRDFDPDLPEESPTRARLDEAYRHVRGRSHIDLQTGERVQVLRPLDRRALIAVVFCVGGCGPDQASGERLAHVWSTPVGMLYLAELVRPHDAEPRFQDRYDAAILIWNPEIGPSSVNWKRRSALRVLQDKGWREAEGFSPPPDPHRQQSSLVIRDLLDVEDVEHPPLRVKCTRHAEALIDREKLLGTLARRQRKRTTAKPLGVSLPEVASVLK